MQLLSECNNGNANIKIYEDGTRVITCDEEILNLKYPLNIDIRISEKCAFGLNPKTGKAVCNFCHESATTDGEDADLNILFNTLSELPSGVELAIGVNQVPEGFIKFLEKCKQKGWIVNITINQGHVRRDKKKLIYLIKNSLIEGLGISYRGGMLDISDELLAYKNTVVHIIAGIDTIDEVMALASKGFKKVLVLGEKDFGFNLGKVKITTEIHRQWYRRVWELFALFDIVSFDNLALEQLNIKRFVKNWDEVYQHEYSFYINAVQRYFSPSSRSNEKTYYKTNNISISQYFKSII